MCHGTALMGGRMRKRGLVVGVATGAMLLAGEVAVPAGGAAATTRSAVGWTNVLNADPDTRVQQSVLALINDRRRARGCGELGLDDRLMVAARHHAAEMANNRYFDHESLSGDTAADRVQETGYRWSRYAENIARGQVNPHQVVRDWMNSPGHRQNILNCTLRQVGVGLAFDTDHTPYWVQDFATPH